MEEGGDTGLLKRYSLVWHGGIVIRLMGLGVSVSSMNIFNIVDRSRESNGLAATRLSELLATTKT